MQVQVLRTYDYQLLEELDVKIFGQEDAFKAEDFVGSACFLVKAGSVIAGSCVFAENMGLGESFDAEPPEEDGTLYVLSTGILPELQGHGIGHVVKAWQIAYARRYGFRKLVTNCRASNARITYLNEKFGFRKTRVVSGFYRDGEETIVMEFKL